MQITVDSNEPLADTLRVLGAVYGVNLTTADGGATPSTATAGRRGSTSRARSGRAQTPRRPKSPETRASDAADPKTIRQWARKNGMTVSGRGALSSTVRDAYQAANAT